MLKIILCSLVLAQASNSCGNPNPPANTGGSSATGGATADGGFLASGGSSNAFSTTGGTQGLTGGKSSVGGSKAVGGSLAIGGSKTTGGNKATGGSTSSSLTLEQQACLNISKLCTGKAYDTCLTEVAQIEALNKYASIDLQCPITKTTKSQLQQQCISVSALCK